jgi:hypothetical protein
LRGAALGLGRFGSFAQNLLFFAPFGVHLLPIGAQNAHNLQHSKK